MDIKPVNPSIYPSPNPSGIKVAFNIDDSPAASTAVTNRRKEKIMIDAIKEVSCTKCLHQEVCRYKPDFLDICNVVSSSIVNRPCENGKKVETTPITNFDFLGGIQIKCRYYQTQAINPRLFDTIITNPCDIHTSPSPCVINTSSNPYTINGSSDCTMPNPLNTIKKEN